MVISSMLCKVGLHEWAAWSKPKKARDTYWGFTGTTQQRVCKRCNKHDVREL